MFLKLNFFKKFNSLKLIISYIINLTVKYHFASAILGFTIVLIIVSQIISGVMLSFSLVPEPMMVPMSRDEEDMDDLYTDDFFWLHERGVDCLFIFSYWHFFRKLYLCKLNVEQEDAWKTGAFTFIFIQVVTFLGLVLCCTHLSDITLKIASNALHTFFFLKTKVYWWLFTDKNLNVDTLIRLAYAHYVVGFLMLGLLTNHAIDMHYDWNNDYDYDGLDNELQWWNEVMINEIISTFYYMIFIFGLVLLAYTEPEATGYELFMWGDVGLITDPKFAQVAPHWYFRPLMAFLLVVPHAKIGLFGLAYFFIIVYHQTTINNISDDTVWDLRYKNVDKTHFNYLYAPIKYPVSSSLVDIFLFYFFFFSCMYTTTFLPNGEYYQLLGGNEGLLFAFFFIFVYLTIPNFKKLTTIYNMTWSQYLLQKTLFEK